MPVDIVNPEKFKEALFDIEQYGGVVLKGFGPHDLNSDTQRSTAELVGAVLMKEIRLLSTIDFALIDGSKDYVDTKSGRHKTPAAILAIWNTKVRPLKAAVFAGGPASPSGANAAAVVAGAQGPSTGVIEWTVDKPAADVGVDKGVGLTKEAAKGLEKMGDAKEAVKAEGEKGEKK